MYFRFQLSRARLDEQLDSAAKNFGKVRIPVSLLI